MAASERLIGHNSSAMFFIILKIRHEAGLDFKSARILGPRASRLTLRCLRQRSVSREALGPRMVRALFDHVQAFSYPEPFLRAVNGARRGALAKSISNWHLIGYNEGYCSNNVYIFYHVFMVSGFGFGQSPSSHRA